MDEKPIYGIWIPLQGWLQAKDDFIAYTSLEQVREISRNIGRGARVRFIDTDKEVNNLLQKLYLEQESRSLCHYFKKLLARKPNKSA